MALIKLTAIVDNISGKLNGTVFARNKGGHYMRSKSNPTNPRSTFQTEMRARFGSIASIWRTLPQGVRNAWDNIASDFPYQNRLGDTKILSGFSLFQKLTYNKTLTGASPDSLSFVPVAPQTMFEPTDASGLIAISETTGDLSLAEVDFNGLGPVADSKVLIYATAPFSKGISNFENRLRLIEVADVPAGPGGKTIDITESYGERFGDPTEGEKVGFALRIVNQITGQGSVQISYATEVSTSD